METDAETLAEAILLTADVSCLKALLEVRNEIVAAGHTPSAQVPTTDDLNVAIEKLLAHQLYRGRGTRRVCRACAGIGPALAQRQDGGKGLPARGPEP